MKKEQVENFFKDLRKVIINEGNLTIEKINDIVRGSELESACMEYILTRVKAHAECQENGRGSFGIGKVLGGHTFLRCGICDNKIITDEILLLLSEIPEKNKMVISDLIDYKESDELDSEVLSYLNSNMNDMMDTKNPGNPEKALRFMEYMEQHYESMAKKELRKAAQLRKIAQIIKDNLEENK